MLRKLFWLTLALFPLLAALAIYELHDVAVWKSLLAAGMPVAIVDGLRDEAWKATASRWKSLLQAT